MAPARQPHADAAGVGDLPAVHPRARSSSSGANILVCLGGPSAQTLLNIRDGITKSRGRWYPFQAGSREVRALATFHPAFLLRSPLQKRLAWRDFLALRKALAN